VLFVLLVVRRLIVGPEAEGLFTLFALAFFLIGLALFGIGLLGEYIGRIYIQVRQRPRYLISAVVEQTADPVAVIPGQSTPEQTARSVPPQTLNQGEGHADA